MQLEVSSADGTVDKQGGNKGVDWELGWAESCMEFEWPAPYTAAGDQAETELKIRVGIGAPAQMMIGSSVGLPFAVVDEK